MVLTGERNCMTVKPFGMALMAGELGRWVGTEYPLA
jgi:hypothetical protein